MRGYEWQLWGNYGYGWDLLTTESTRTAINAREREYRANESSALYKLKRVKEDK